MKMAKSPELSLGACGLTMPVLGMGTSSYPLPDPETARLAIIEAIKAGYRHFDTAFVYGSEKPLGQAIAEALHLGLIKSREELFITSKLWSCHTDRDQVVPAIKMSLRNLQLDYLDMFLIHMPLKLSEPINKTPVPKELLMPLDISSVWEGMEECQTLGLTKAIGVSNFPPRMLEETLAIAKIPPAVNQVEMNPLWQQKKLREFCNAKGIHITAYCPLGANGTKWGDNRILECDVLEDIAKARGKTTAQVALRWVYEQGVSIVAKSFHKERMRQNLEIFDWSLSEEDLKRISELPQRKGFLLSSIIGAHDLVLEMDKEI